MYFSQIYRIITKSGWKWLVLFLISFMSRVAKHQSWILLWWVRRIVYVCNRNVLFMVHDFVINEGWIQTPAEQQQCTLILSWVWIEVTQSVSEISAIMSSYFMNIVYCAVYGLLSWRCELSTGRGKLMVFYGAPKKNTKLRTNQSPLPNNRVQWARLCSSRPL